MSNTNPNRYERGDVAVEWYNADEGWDGDYDPTDPDDVNLLRFDFYGRINGHWMTVNDASYCTQVPASTPEPVLAELLEILMDNGEDIIKEAIGHFPPEDAEDFGEFDVSDRKAFEWLSWIAPKEMRTHG